MSSFFSAARAHIPGKNKFSSNWITGKNEGFFRIVSIVKSETKKTKKEQTIAKIAPVALAAGSTCALGREYTYRYCESEARYDSDHGRFLGFMLGAAGVDATAEPAVLAKALDVDISGLDLDEDEKNLVDWAKYQVEMGKAVDSLFEQLVKGEGTAAAGQIIYVESYEKIGKESGNPYTITKYLAAPQEILTEDGTGFIPEAVAGMLEEGYEVHPDFMPSEAAAK